MHAIWSVLTRPNTLEKLLSRTWMKNLLGDCSVMATVYIELDNQIHKN